MILDDKQMVFLGSEHRRVCHNVARRRTKIHEIERPSSSTYLRMVANLIPPTLRPEIVVWLNERDCDFELLLSEIVFANPSDEMEFKLRWG